MSSREEILSTIRLERPKLDRPLPDVPIFDEVWSCALLAVFKQSLERMGGSFLEAPITGDVLRPVRNKIAGAKAVCSLVPEITGTQDIEQVNSAAELPDVHIAIVRASFAVAETGSVLLSEDDPRVNAVACLAPHLLVLLDPVDILVNLHHAFHRAEFRSGHHASWRTGPPATADIEGMLVHGVQGVRSLTVFPIARGAGDTPVQ
ncbi:LutC/YkgG family protein [Bradyrhizobium sp. DASA03120]|uniref:LutC/YkgG family protein n=1 Tax=Bradyrhizobium sp. SMVTL-02 TaxID=3395917 RepID=UPI003F704601